MSCGAGGAVNPALIALAGVVVGGGVTFLSQYLLQRTEQQHLARRVACGLAGEIGALLEIAERRHYVSALRDMAQSTQPLRPSIRATRNYFKVFGANADKVGLLGGDLPERVAAFYVRGSAILEDFDAISAPEFVTWTLEEQRQYYTATADLLEETVALGKEAVERLRTFSRA